MGLLHKVRSTPLSSSHDCVYNFNDSVEGGVSSDCHVSSTEVIVNGAHHPHDVQGRVPLGCFFIDQTWEESERMFRAEYLWAASSSIRPGRRARECLHEEEHLYNGYNRAQVRTIKTRLQAPSLRVCLFYQWKSTLVKNIFCNISNMSNNAKKVTIHISKRSLRSHIYVNV